MEKKYIKIGGSLFYFGYCEPTISADGRIILDESEISPVDQETQGSEIENREETS